MKMIVKTFLLSHLQTVVAEAEVSSSVSVFWHQAELLMDAVRFCCQHRS